MSAPLRRQAAFAIAYVCAALLACNAIVGVEDVSPRDTPGSRSGGGGERMCDPESEDCDELTPSDAGPTPPDTATLALGYNHTCARMTDGTVRCWGDNGAGQAGDGIPFDGSRPDLLEPQAVPGVDDAIAIAAGLAHTCVVRKNNSVSCWGLNSFGQLGDGTKERSSKPVTVVGLDDAVSLAGGTSFTCALRKDKTVACWGANYSGQLGDGLEADSRLTVEPVKGLGGVVSIAAASDHACAVLETGEVMCWGKNADGQLGIGSTTKSLLPAKLEALSDIVQVAAAASFSCALQRSGRVYCWGKNEHGELGNGSPNGAPNPSPSLVPSIPDATFIWTGFEHACAVRKGGAVVCWGSAGSGQLGSGTVPSDASIATPVSVVGMPPALAVWTGGLRSCAIATDGRAFCWGTNALGQLGNGTTERAYAAVPVRNFP